MNPSLVLISGYGGGGYGHQGGEHLSITVSLYSYSQSLYLRSV